jgi:protocatechuate 3,4-dioxygenase beta subunit
LQQAGAGLAAVGTAGLILRADARPTVTVSAKEVGRILIQMGPPPKEAIIAKGELKKITPVSFGPMYKQGAPFRAKLCPPFEPGTPFVMTGRAWAFDTKRPLAGVVLDIWHVDHQGNYSAGDGDFKNRGRLVTTEAGYYEFESIRPVPYQPNASQAPNFWRCAHFHLFAVCPGYKQLVTEIHFQDDPRRTDPMYRPENAIAAEKRVVNGKTVEMATFDIVLERDPGSKLALGSSRAIRFRNLMALAL